MESSKQDSEIKFEVENVLAKLNSDLKFLNPTVWGVIAPETYLGIWRQLPNFNMNDACSLQSKRITNFYFFY